ncbi:MAG: rRNA pseudouridine synthase [Oscillospiraceae bacterium]|nr:rRNA pseudouridine synthase [Oscillospiraceae bacterium]
MDKKRLQKIIAERGYCSRRNAEELIIQGKVRVNGRVAKIGESASESDLITIGGKKIAGVKNTCCYMLYKPRGYVTTMKDEKGRRCVADLIGDIKERVYPVGRLDVNSEGLLLLTNNGDLANKLTHPRNHVQKVYRVTIRPGIDEEQLARLESGIEIDGEMTAPAAVNVITEGKERVVVEMSLYEGRNRQIRKMLEALGLETARLKRISVGGVKLGMLAPGQHRPLTDKELKSLT